MPALAASVLVGLWQGALIAKVRMQPFVVTLCGLFLFRGIARLVASDNTQGFGDAIPGFKLLSTGSLLGLGIPIPFLLFLGIAVVVGAAPIGALNHLVNILEIPSQLEYVVIGGAILAGVFVDEVFSRRPSPGSE